MFVYKHTVEYLKLSILHRQIASES